MNPARRRAPLSSPIRARLFVDDALADLRASRWSPRGWGRFLLASLARSWEDAVEQRCALAELSAVHLVAAVARRSRPWLLGSWAMAVTHLGLLGDSPRCLGWANRLTLLRANLPALAPQASPWIGAVVLASDLADGAIARRSGDATAFGGYADVLADIAVWSWYVRRHERDPGLRALCLAVWLAPACAVIAAYLARGPSPTRGRCCRATSPWRCSCW